MKTLVFVLTLAAVLALACGGDKPPMVPDPDLSGQPDAALTGD